MHPCLPQNWLRSGGTLQVLEDMWHIKATRHKNYPNLVHLKYDQLASPFGDDIVRQCRGLILNDINFDVVARPFDKFFNYGEQHAAQIDWTTAIVQEKLDGSLVYMYWYDNDWHIATSGTPDASGPVGNATGLTFSKLFWMVFNEMDYDLPHSIYRNNTFIFELMTPYNRVVVKHDKPMLKLLGVRNNLNGEEYPPERFNLTYEVVDKYNDLKSLADVMEVLPIVDPLVQEGYVVVDAAFNRIKIKHPGYVQLHKLRSSISIKNILEVVRTGETAQLLAHFPEWRGSFEQVQATYNGLIQHLESEFDRLKDIEAGREGQKLFAEEALRSPCSGILFAMRRGFYKSARDGLKEVHIDRLVDVLGVRDVQIESI